MTPPREDNYGNNDMPQWIDDCHMDPQWLASKTTTAGLVSATLRGFSIPVQDIGTNQSRLGGSVPRSGGTLLLKIVPADVPAAQEGVEKNTENDKKEDDAAVPLELVLKQITAERADLSKNLGLAREALFYAKLAPRLQSNSNKAKRNILPTIHYSHGNMETGEKCIVMESLSSWIDSGVFFKPNPPTFRGNPHNWTRNLDGIIQTAYRDKQRPSTKTIAESTFRAVAQIHASFWRDASLLDESNDWLRAHAWIQGNGRESWEASQSYIRNIWKEYTSKTSIAPDAAAAAADNNNNNGDDNEDIQWNPCVRQAVEKCVAGISWPAQLQRLHVDGQWTLVHGDFWPGNVMWNPATNDNDEDDDDDDDSPLRLLDWEMVGLGSGPQDLGQYVISNMDPVERRACEHDLVQAYYQELIRCGVPEKDNDGDFLWEYCWKEYKIGGVERWLWFLVWFVGQPSLLDWAQLFHDQIAAFMSDHKLTAADLTQPRP